MKASLRALLTNVIDYAGLFPPAELSLDESIRNYARYRTEHEAWMLGRFICPAARLKELAPYVAELFGRSGPIDVSALGRPGQTREGFDGFSGEFEAIREFERNQGGRARVSVFEGQLPDGVGFASAGNRREIFLESTRNTAESIHYVIQAAGVARHGFKLRTGGVEASAFPPSELIAFALIMCRDHSVPIKFTAGLHHPIRHFNKSVDTKMHGFINVFVAGVLAHVEKLNEQRLVEILDDEDAASFTFDDDSLRWRDHRATTEQVASLRKDRITSFGSCSFDEPRDDLRALGWL